MAADTTAEKLPGIPGLSLRASNMFSTEYHQFRQAWASNLVLSWQNLPEWGALLVTPHFLTFSSRGRREHGPGCRITSAHIPRPPLRPQWQPPLTSTATPQCQTWEVTNVSDWRCKELWTVPLGHGKGRRHYRQQDCSAGGEAMPSSVRSRGRTGGGTEVVLTWNPTVKSSHKVQQLLFFPLLRAPSFTFQNSSNYEYKETHGFCLQLKQESVHCVIADMRE